MKCVSTRRSSLVFGAVVYLSLSPYVVRAQQLHSSLNPPERVLAGDRPIDIERTGHAAPFFGDIDNDGLPDLLVGEYFDGRVRAYRNVGTEQEPKFSEFEWIKAGQGLAKVPSD